MINPNMIFQIKNLWDRFERNHPKFPRFLQAVGQECIENGTVIEISVTKANGENITSNLRLNEEDLELVRTIRDLAGRSN
jgi:hypothetical protein